MQVVGLWAAHDPGKVIFPQGAYGQLYGGIAQGLGYALMEQITYTDGYLQETNFESYLIPTSVDVPELVGTFVEAPFSQGPYGAKNIAEPSMVPTAPGDPQRHLPRDGQARPRPARQPGARPARAATWQRAARPRRASWACTRHTLQQQVRRFTGRPENQNHVQALPAASAFDSQVLQYHVHTHKEKE